MPDGTTATESMRAAIIAALPRLRRFCHAMASSPADGDDLMQSTVEKALTHCDQFRAGSRVDSWMYRIAQNLHIDRSRATRRRGTVVPVEDAYDLVGDDGRATVESRSELAAAQHALSTVPEDQRAAFVLVVVEGLSYKEAAEALEVPIGTIMSRIARARGRIERALGGDIGALQ
ncbi:RNA polymerase sigma factor [Sphingobium sp. HBC34]|uniref:RNA polymerase sigma factor n=1 Tax=Sphingobium cyanobacteriorum TaxID=3063954 RepID=A0ABT8ZRJ1_9SPHN|nr:RNA polymerase sigma factor [Sphingobium sp. HBC34]MDO7837162.1 RNA polymerase sigma factor [Sphingobium sp. HBC34]